MLASPACGRGRAEGAGEGPTLRAGMSAIVEIDTGKQNSLLGRLQGAKEPVAAAKIAARD